MGEPSEHSLGHQGRCAARERFDPCYQKPCKQKEHNHDGTRAIIFLKPVPKGFVLQLRVRYNEIENQGGYSGSLREFGHHVNSLIVRDSESVHIHFRKKKLRLPETFFSLNACNHVTVKIKGGTLLIEFNDKAILIAGPLVTLTSTQQPQQINFKGLPIGTVQIDWIKHGQRIE